MMLLPISIEGLLNPAPPIPAVRDILNNLAEQKSTDRAGTVQAQDHPNKPDHTRAWTPTAAIARMTVTPKQTESQEI
jgi:hypothetical protein